MTCVVGLIDNGKVYIGADSAASAGENIEIRTNRKVFRNGVYVIGFTGSYRVGQLMQYTALAKPTGKDVLQHLVLNVVDKLKELSGKDIDELLIGHGGRLFKISSDYSVAEFASHAAVGSGARYALGRLHGALGNPDGRILAALEAAEANCTGVRPPFHIEMA
ncbi:hypothetical protein [Mesorhizobium sp. M1B.F.Ca.ET.045.04.1.1]|uniref:hypothetical protein n=1 Tax=Mesorhizobium sp. M1B.F.Ca.ET.045.04.1.1 TaxID=2493673 RepID=UPI0011AE5CB1|nr:hypothetical protein [Mesorhizobium sp. M1B.F.Ca.ET.045.04.1.1]